MKEGQERRKGTSALQWPICKLTAPPREATRTLTGTERDLLCGAGMQPTREQERHPPFRAGIYEWLVRKKGSDTGHPPGGRPGQCSRSAPIAHGALVMGLLLGMMPQPRHLVSSRDRAATEQ